jgi:hypothetical protein
MVGIGGILEVLKPVAVANVAERVIVPQPLADRHHVVAVRRVDDVEHRQQRGLGVWWTIQRLFTTQPRAPTHFPEIGLEPGRFLEDRDQLGFARGCDIEMGEPV